MFDIVIMGYWEMYDIMVCKNVIYMDFEAMEVDGLLAVELENKFGEMGGWNVESDVAELFSNLGIYEFFYYC